MSDRVALQADSLGLPLELRVVRSGTSVVRSPPGISSAPFWVEHLLSGTGDGEPTAMRAMFDPGVRTHWHSHPRGQFLVVANGTGLVQRLGGAVVEIRAGDSVWFAPGEVHWHGAADESVFGYVSVQAVQDGTAVHWLKPV